MEQASAIAPRIKAFLLKVFPLIRKRGVADDENLLESGLIDSLGILDVVHFLEEEFGIEVSDEELVPENFQSLCDLTLFVTKKKTNPEGSLGPLELCQEPPLPETAP